MMKVKEWVILSLHSFIQNSNKELKMKFFEAYTQVLKDFDSEGKSCEADDEMILHYCNMKDDELVPRYSTIF